MKNVPAYVISCHISERGNMHSLESIHANEKTCAERQMSMLRTKNGLTYIGQNISTRSKAHTYGNTVISTEKNGIPIMHM